MMVFQTASNALQSEQLGISQKKTKLSNLYRVKCKVFSKDLSLKTFVMTMKFGVLPQASRSKNNLSEFCLPAKW